MKVYETELPGTGVRYTLQFGDDGALVVLLHNDGDRELFWRDAADDDADRLFRVDEDDARKLSAILEGTYFHPVDEGLEDVFENARIRWVHVATAAPVAGRTVGEASIRSRTGVTVLGVRRGDETITEVDAGTAIDPDDVLICVGSEEAHDRLRALLAGAS
ncbi:cation:proton antiporter regulatory subunit [Haloarchaeobius litoreus]|uniref:Cation:proton antiporter regulatory subunit n=1 Tax=Haloarchaeobius litoreus TaxID=755306 RepID=A0ABD6DL80_9EURY|nr:TrkA C-terminal domain-containing protein [Haloarchaeobius litoreus]